MKARNEYILCLEATNSTVHKYFVDDLSDLMDCMDFGFHHCVTKALKMQTSSEEGRIRSMQAGLDATNLIVSAMDSGVDKQRFLEFNHTAFMIPKKFEFQGQKDEVIIVCFIIFLLLFYLHIYYYLFSMRNQNCKNCFVLIWRRGWNS